MTKSTSKRNIEIKGARVHNLKNIDVSIPRNELVVITGLSGSGKSSLAFDTLFAEGQRRYVESLSSYARQFLGKLDKPDVDTIKGISPAIAIEQKVNTTNSRSTVGTTTEIFDYLKLLFARIGRTYSPVSGAEVKKDGLQDVLDFLLQFPEGSKAIILSPIETAEDQTDAEKINLYKSQGYQRVWIDNEIVILDDFSASGKPLAEAHLVIDRIQINSDQENISRIAESVATAFFEGKGELKAIVLGNINKTKTFSNKFELDGITFTEPDINFFTFNNPIGACKTCEGFGQVLGIDPDLVFPDPSLSIYNEAIAPWRGDKMTEWNNALIYAAGKFNFPVHRPIMDLTEKEMEVLWNGNQHFQGLNIFFKFIESQSYKIQYRVMLSRYRGKTNCPDCKGNKLRKDANYVKIGGMDVTSLTNCSITECKQFFDQLDLTNREHLISERILKEIRSRLYFLCDVGLGYLTLNRASNTLSGGESQRINLATSLGSPLVGSMYILDEPSIGLHSKDTGRLIKVLRNLQQIGNSVIVVEHDEEVMEAADQIIDMGPFAGAKGGNVIFQGTHEDLLNSESLTAKYLTNRESIPVPAKKRRSKDFLKLSGVRINNLKSVSVEIPLHTVTVISGVSGSGKSTLVRNALFPAIQKHLTNLAVPTKIGTIAFDRNQLQFVEFIDQNPIGKSSRSNPVTYVKAWDEIRNLYCDIQLSKINGFKPKHFSFNVEGGRCDACEGEGQITVSMQFMADVHLKCETCSGKRFKDDVLEVKYQDKNVFDLLEMTIDQAIEFFEHHTNKHTGKILEKLNALHEVGLGYVKLGQSSNTLSGGEAQRIKLASFLIKKNNPVKTLFIFDEPTTGLHFHDIKKLLNAINELVVLGHSVVIIEHNLDVIKCADWVIDLGPEGGEGGGHVLFSGPPEELIHVKNSATGHYLRKKFEVPNRC